MILYKEQVRDELEKLLEEVNKHLEWLGEHNISESKAQLLIAKSNVLLALAEATH